MARSKIPLFAVILVLVVGNVFAAAPDIDGRAGINILDLQAMVLILTGNAPFNHLADVSLPKNNVIDLLDLVAYVNLWVNTPSVSCSAAADCANFACAGSDKSFCDTSGTCDCMSGASASCSNGVKDGSETDVDCGGSCARCVNGGSCLQDSDCASNDCDNGVCQSCTVNDYCVAINTHCSGVPYCDSNTGDCACGSTGLGTVCDFFGKPAVVCSGTGVACTSNGAACNWGCDVNVGCHPAPTTLRGSGAVLLNGLGVQALVGIDDGSTTDGSKSVYSSYITGEPYATENQLNQWHSASYSDQPWSNVKPFEKIPISGSTKSYVLLSPFFSSQSRPYSDAFLIGTLTSVEGRNGHTVGVSKLVLEENAPADPKNSCQGCWYEPPYNLRSSCYAPGDVQLNMYRFCATHSWRDAGYLPQQTFSGVPSAIGVGEPVRVNDGKFAAIYESQKDFATIASDFGPGGTRVVQHNYANGTNRTYNVSNSLPPNVIAARFMENLRQTLIANGVHGVDIVVSDNVGINGNYILLKVTAPGRTAASVASLLPQTINSDLDMDGTPDASYDSDATRKLVRPRFKGEKQWFEGDGKTGNTGLTAVAHYNPTFDLRASEYLGSGAPSIEGQMTDVTSQVWVTFWYKNAGASGGRNHPVVQKGGTTQTYTVSGGTYTLGVPFVGELDGRYYAKINDGTSTSPIIAKSSSWALNGERVSVVDISTTDPSLSTGPGTTTDTTPPTINVKPSTTVSAGDEVWVECNDGSGSGCSDAYYFYVTGVGQCDPNSPTGGLGPQYSFADPHKVAITQDSDICWQAWDLANNLAEGTQTISVTGGASGSTGPSLGSSCTLHEDCQSSLYCNSLTLHEYCDSNNKCGCTTTSACSDPDGGRNTDVRSTVDYHTSSNTIIPWPTDVCDESSRNKVREFYCNGDQAAATTITCPTVRPYCYRGACSTTPNTCTDSDGGNNPNVKGFTQQDGEFGIYDSCSTINPDELTEWFCGSNLRGDFRTHNCPHGCANGACLPDPNAGSGNSGGNPNTGGGNSGSCGDGVIQGGAPRYEECDGSNIEDSNGNPISSCSQIGRPTGPLRCYGPNTATPCKIDVSSCTGGSSGGMSPS